MKNNTQDVVGYRISQLDRPFDFKPNQATTRGWAAWAVETAEQSELQCKNAKQLAQARRAAETAE